MKKLIIFIYISLFCTFSLSAQTKVDKIHKKIKTLKIAYLTEQLNLTSDVAEKFWPIYNAHNNKTNKDIRVKLLDIKKEIKKAGSVDNLDDKRAVVLFEMIENLEKNKYEENKTYISKLKKVLSVKDILKLQIAEREFGRNLMRKYRNKDSKTIKREKGRK
jgi:Skp family chaperone for outer membrane proteins